MIKTLKKAWIYTVAVTKALVELNWEEPILPVIAIITTVIFGIVMALTNG